MYVHKYQNEKVEFLKCWHHHQGQADVHIQCYVHTHCMYIDIPIISMFVCTYECSELAIHITVILHL